MTPTPDNMLNNLHYLFSTAPQVIGAILAITGAFVVFKYNSLKEELLGITQKLVDRGKPEKDDEYDTDDKPELSTNSAIMKSLFENTYSRFKYAQISKRIDVITDIIEEVVSKEDEQKKVILGEQEKYGSNVKDEFGYAIDDCKNVLERKKDIDLFIQNTVTVYKINGLLLGTLIIPFLFLPHIGIGVGYWVTLIGGIVITITSLSLIVSYLIESIQIR